MIKIYNEIVQGSDEWYALRCGLLTASEMKLIITPAKLQYASNDKERSHLYELVAQRITKFVEPHYINDDMLRGNADEIEAKNHYKKNYPKWFPNEDKPCVNVGFMTNDKWGFVIGYSPDLLVGDDGQVECKSRRQKYQIETVFCDDIPSDFIIQVQTGMLVSERSWCDFVSYSGGLHMFTHRVYPDAKIQQAIVECAAMFEGKAADLLSRYDAIIEAPGKRFVPTERKNYDAEITVA